MTDLTLVNLVFLSVGLGLLGFIERCSMGSNLLFIKYLEGKVAARKLAQSCVFMLTRGLIIGLLGALAALIGSTFVTAQKGFWILLGSVYLVLGVLYLVGRAGFLMRTLGPGLGACQGRGDRSHWGSCSGSTSRPARRLFSSSCSQPLRSAARP